MKRERAYWVPLAVLVSLIALLALTIKPARAEKRVPLATVSLKQPLLLLADVRAVVRCIRDGPFVTPVVFFNRQKNEELGTEELNFKTPNGSKRIHAEFYGFKELRFYVHLLQFTAKKPTFLAVRIDGVPIAGSNVEIAQALMEALRACGYK